MRLIAQLRMPGKGSWNGQWSGDNDVFTINVSASPKQAEKLIGNYSYSWSDGWRASVCIRKPEPRERVTGKFCGYEWMVSEIKQYGEIKCL